MYVFLSATSAIRWAAACPTKIRNRRCVYLKNITFLLLRMTSTVTYILVSNARNPARPMMKAAWYCGAARYPRSEEHTSELQSRENLVCRLLLEKKKKENNRHNR